MKFKMFILTFFVSILMLGCHHSSEPTPVPLPQKIPGVDFDIHDITYQNNISSMVVKNLTEFEYNITFDYYYECIGSSNISGYNSQTLDMKPYLTTSAYLGLIQDLQFCSIQITATRGYLNYYASPLAPWSGTYSYSKTFNTSP